jgi:hypothetical protein
MERVPHVHDYTRRYWGKDITYRVVDGQLVGSLWCPTRVRVGDFLILANGDSTTRYRLTEVRPAMDPDDMYHFTATFDPR